MDTLRPAAWDDYIGQERLKRELDIRIRSAIEDDRPLDHLLLCADPGVGKTALAEVIADRLAEPFQILTMPITAKTLIKFVTGFEGIVLLDELHRCSTKEQEQLLPLLEFGFVADSSGRKHNAGWLTIIGATTERRKLIDPLIDRFPLVPTFEKYTDEQMTQVVKRMASMADVTITDEDALVFGRAATGTPRKARRFVLAFHDLCNTSDHVPSPAEVLDLCNTSDDGLTASHRTYLETLDALGGVKGVRVISSLMRMSETEIEKLEHLLILKGYLEYGERGRELTQAGAKRARGEIVARGNPRSASAA